MRLTERVHQRLQAHLKTGDTAIDATAGNGYDTAKLARLVGSSGHVIAIDIQQSAIDSTRRRLSETKQLDTVALHCADHAALLAELEPQLTGQVAAITFNLGYLPGSDKSIQTQAATSCAALESSSKLLKAGGLLFVTAYRGHEGGMDEAQEVATWLQALPSEAWSLECYEPEKINPDRPSPILWVAQRNDSP